MHLYTRYCSLILSLVLLDAGLVFAAPEKAKSLQSALTATSPLPTPNKIIASVDGEPLTLKDLHDYLKNVGLETIPEEGTEEFKRYYDDFLTQVLVEKEAKVLGIEVSLDDTSAYIEEIKKQNQVDDQQLVKLLSGKGMTLAAYRVQIQQEILRTRLTQQHARSTISISDKDVSKRLGVDVPEQPAVATRHLFQVFVPLDEDGKTNDFRLAETSIGLPETSRERRLEIVTKIRDNTTGPEQLKSLGGSFFSDLGVVNADDLFEDLRDTVLDLDEGDLSDVVETPRGFYIFGLTAVTETAPEVKSGEREMAKRQIFEDKLKSEMTNFISKDLPKKYNLERKL